MRELFRQLSDGTIPDFDYRFCDVEQLLAAVLGGDHDGSRQRMLLSEFVLPSLEAKSPEAKFGTPQLVREILDSPHLRVDTGMARRLFEIELQRLVDERQFVLSNETYHPHECPSLARWAAELVQARATSEVQGLVPGLLALLRKREWTAAGTLNTLAPLLSPNQAFTAFAVALDLKETFGWNNQWFYMSALVERLTPQQAETLALVAVDRIERQELPHGREVTGPFEIGGLVLTRFAQKLEPAQRTQVGLAALRLLAQESDGDRLSLLTIALLPVLGSLERDQVAPVLRPWLEQLPSRVARIDNDTGESVLTAAGDHAAAWMDKVDPADLLHAAQRLRDLLVEQAARGSPKSRVAMALGAWAPMLTPSDAFEIAQPLVKEVAKHSAFVMATLSPTLEQLGQRLSSRHALALAQVLASGDYFDSARERQGLASDNYLDWAQGRLELCLQVLKQRMDEKDRQRFKTTRGSRTAP